MMSITSFSRSWGGPAPTSEPISILVQSGCFISSTGGSVVVIGGTIILVLSPGLNSGFLRSIGATGLGGTKVLNTDLGGAGIGMIKVQLGALIVSNRIRNISRVNISEREPARP